MTVENEMRGSAVQTT